MIPSGQVCQSCFPWKHRHPFKLPVQAFRRAKGPRQSRGRSAPSSRAGAAGQLEVAGEGQGSLLRHPECGGDVGAARRQAAAGCCRFWPASAFGHTGGPAWFCFVMGMGQAVAWGMGGGFQSACPGRFVPDPAGRVSSRQIRHLRPSPENRAPCRRASRRGWPAREPGFPSDDEMMMPPS